MNLRPYRFAICALLSMLIVTGPTSYAKSTSSSDDSDALRHEQLGLRIMGIGASVGLSVFFSGLVIGAMGDPDPSETKAQQDQHHKQYLRSLGLVSGGVALTGVAIGLPIYLNGKSQDKKSADLSVRPVITTSQTGVRAGNLGLALDWNRRF